MAREDTPLDQAVFDATLAAELAKGSDRRVAEGRARSAAVRAYKAAHPEEEAAAPAPAAAAAAAAAAPAGSAPAAAPAAAAPAAMAPAAAVAVATPVTTPVRTAPLPTGNIPTPKKGANDKHRLLALVPPEGIQRVEREQGDRVNVWPHLLIEEFVAMLILTAGLLVFSTFVMAPLRQLANPNLTPNPSKAPWYFLGLQELLRYFHPMIAGITIPTFILVGLAAVPYVDRNPSVRPGDRKIAISMFTILFCFGATLTIIGCFFRGPGYNWIWPWAQGVFFDL
ncbi:MAG: menaquinol-cytochrome c reductase cytochrome b subunit [Actinomycetota bacterium]